MALSHSPSIVTNGLVLNLDAANRRSYPGTGTVWNDLSGNNNHGTLTNGPTFNDANGGAIVFDGSNDYVHVGSGLSMPGNLTVCIWVLPSSLNSTSVIIGRMLEANSFPQNYVLYQQSSTFRFNIKSGASYNTVVGSTVTGTPTYLCGVCNGSNSILYVNTVSYTGNFSGSPDTSDNQNLAIGARWGNNAQDLHFNGKVFSTCIYNRALSASEVAQNFNALRGRFGI